MSELLITPPPMHAPVHLRLLKIYMQDVRLPDATCRSDARLCSVRLLGAVKLLATIFVRADYPCHCETQYRTPDSLST